MTTFLLFGYFGCPTKSGFHALQANTQAKHEIIQCGETFALSTTGLSRPPWCHWSSFSAVLWNPVSLMVSRVIWASFRGFWLPFSEYLRRQKCKAFLFPNPSLFPQCLLGVSGYSCLLMPIGTLCNSHQLQNPFSVLLTPATHISWSTKKSANFVGFFLLSFLKLWDSEFQFCLYNMKKFTSFFQWKLWFSHSITANEKGHSKQLWDEVHDKWGGS